MKTVKLYTVGLVAFLCTFAINAKTIYVTNTKDTPVGTKLKANSNDISFRQALENAEDGDVIKFDRLSCLQSQNSKSNTPANEVLEIFTNGEPFYITKSVTIDGSSSAPDADIVIFTTGADTTYPTFWISTPGTDVVLKNLQITGGKIADDHSGVIHAQGIDSLLLEAVILSPNSSSKSAAYIDEVNEFTMTLSTLFHSTKNGLFLQNINRTTITRNNFELFMDSGNQWNFIRGSVYIIFPTGSGGISGNTFRTVSPVDGTSTLYDSSSLSTTIQSSLGVMITASVSSGYTGLDNNTYETGYTIAGQGNWYNASYTNDINQADYYAENFNTLEGAASNTNTNLPEYQPGPTP